MANIIKLSLIMFILMFLAPNISAQSKVLLHPDHTFVFKASLQKENFKSKCPCEFYPIKKGLSCQLYSINIQDIYLVIDTVNIKKSILEKMKFIVAIDTADLSIPGSKIIAATYSSSEKYLKFSEVLQTYDKSTVPIGVYNGGISRCIKFNLWQKIMIFLGFDIEKASMRRLKKKKFQRNRFTEYILSKE